MTRRKNPTKAPPKTTTKSYAVSLSPDQELHVQFAGKAVKDFKRESDRIIARAAALRDEHRRLLAPLKAEAKLLDGLLDELQEVVDAMNSGIESIDDGLEKMSRQI